MTLLCHWEDTQRGEGVYLRSHSRGNKNALKKASLVKEDEERSDHPLPDEGRKKHRNLTDSVFQKSVHFTGKKTDARERPPPQPDPIGVAEARMVLSLADSHCTLS